MELNISYENVSDLKPYQNNAKIHTEEQIGQIAESIKEFGMNDPIAVWKNGEIIEGHGRLEACKRLGIKTVPVIHLDDLTDDQRRAYMNVHNQLTMNTGFDLVLLTEELDKIKDIDMSLFGFESRDVLEEQEITEPQNATDELPESKVYICAVSAFGTKSETVIYKKLPQEIADQVLSKMQDGGGSFIADRLVEVLNAL